MDKYFLNLAGEYRVCAELLRRGLFATITYGNKKGADIYVVGEEKKVAVVEVKASQSKKFVTGFYQKYKSPNVDHPDFWVLAAMSESRDRFFVLTHEEMERTQCKRNCPGEDLGWEEAAIRSTNGVDNVLVRNVEDHKDRWDKIARHVRASL